MISASTFVAGIALAFEIVGIGVSFTLAGTEAGLAQAGKPYVPTSFVSNLTLTATAPILFYFVATKFILP